MVSNLFNNEIEEKTFYNLIATRKYVEINNEKKSYDDDIEEFIKKCDDILSENNARCNFVAEILARKDITPQIHTNTGYNDNNHLTEIDALTKEFLEFLETVPLNIKEDIEFYSKRIDDRIERALGTSLAQQTILEYYPIADKLNIKETLDELSAIFNNIASFDTNKIKEDNDFNNDNLSEYVEPITSISNNNPFEINEDINEIDLPVVDDTLFIEKEEIKLDEPLLIEKEEVEDINTSKRYEVIGIKKLPTKETTLEIEQEKQGIKLLDSDSLINLEDLKPKIKLEEIKPQISFEEINQPDLNKTFITETNFNLLDFEESTSDLPKEKIELNEAPEKPLDSIDSTNDETVSFKMPKGFSLVDIALALCSDPNGWYDIYEINKETFNDIIKEKNDNNFDNIENNQNIFSGLNIKIPTVFKKEIPEYTKKAA